MVSKAKEVNAIIEVKTEGGAHFTGVWSDTVMWFAQHKFLISFLPQKLMVLFIIITCHYVFSLYK